MIRKGFSWLYIGSLLTAFVAIFMEFIEKNSVSTSEFVIIIFIAITSYIMSDKEYNNQKVKDLLDHD